MPPAGAPKRKRSDRNFSGDDHPRASPHRPQDLNLAKPTQSQPHPQSPTTVNDDPGSTTRRQSKGPRHSNAQTQDAKSASPPVDTTTGKPLSVQPSTVTKPTMNGASLQPGKPSPSSLPPMHDFVYEHITDEIQQDWSGEGGKQVQAQLVDLCDEDEAENVTLDVVVEELLTAATTGRIDAHDAGAVIKESIASLQDAASGDTNRIQDAILSSIPILFAEENPSPHVAELAIFLAATEISADVLRVELDAKLLEQLGLIRSSFHRQVIRKQTNALYRQANYNLLREESEGFSKLVTELFTTSGNEMPHGDVVHSAVEKVKAMIGAFDLDVGRSLDVVLDVFGSVLVKQYRFFVKFLRESPWWPRHESSVQTIGKFSLGGLPAWALPGEKEWALTEQQRSELASQIEERDLAFWTQAHQDGLKAYFHLGQSRSAYASDQSLDLEADAEQHVRETGTIPGAGSREAAQLLGFKLRFYAPGAEGDSAEGTPRNLIYLAALLIKIGFISLHDLYPHLWRPDSEMEDLKNLKQKEKEEKELAARPGAGAANALAKAGALSDDTLPAPLPSRLRDQGTRASTPSKELEPEKTSSKEPLVEKPDQKVLLLQSLLAIGALPEALFILGRFPWMVDLIPDLPEYINRILHHSLSEVYRHLRPLSSRPSLHTQQPICEMDVPGVPKGQTTLEARPQRKTLRWPLLDREDSDIDGINYRFYWDEWNDNIPICRCVDDVFVLSKTLLPLVGAKIGRDTSLILKFARIGKASINEDQSDDNRARWLELIKRILLPSLSLTKSNPGVVNEVFELISMYSTETRYRMYLEWSKGDTSRTTDMRTAFGLASVEAKDVLKRISKTNVKPMARALAKIAYANPHIVITAALPQIESYDSIANVFVEGSRYFTDLGYDVLTWALVVSMGNDNRVGIQADGMFASKWLTALSHFIGKVYKRYNLMKPGPILQYVAKQLNKGSNVDLIILEQLIVAMAGIAPDTSYNESQLLAMGGGPLLQSQTVLQLLDQRHTSKGTAKRLMKALYDCGLVSHLLLAMTQQRQACVFQESDAPLKAVGHQFDEITRVLSQYLDLLRSNMSTDEFQKTIPSTTALLTEWGAPAEIAFWIGRPVLQKQMNDFDRDNAQALPPKEASLDIDMKDDEASEEDGEAIETEDIETSAATPTETEMAGLVDESMPDADEEVEQHWHPVLKGVIDSVKPQLPEEVLSLVGPGFYVTFWQLALYDISVPGNSYQDEMGRTKKKIASITADRSNVSSSSAKVRESQIKSLKQLNEDLMAENRSHLKSYTESKTRLIKEKDQWFAAKSRVSKELNHALMEHCFLPRILLSPLDAYFCFKFAKLLHTLGAANFRTLGFYDTLFKAERLSSLFFMCTSKEADNLAKFLLEILKDLSRWHKSKAVYERDAFGTKRNLPGFALKVENGKPQALLDFQKFRDVFFKWQSALYSALVKCLTSSEYMHIRNAISVLRIVAPAFPAIDFHGRSLQKSADKIRESDREDLKVASSALLGTLSRRTKEWMSPEVFRKGPGAAPEKPVPIPESKDEKPKAETVTADARMKDAPPTKTEKSDAPVKDPEKTPSSHSREGRSPSRTSTPLPARPPRDAALRPPRPDSRAHDLPRRVSPPPRFNSNTLPSRPETDTRNGYRDARPPRSSAEPPRPDSRGGYPPRHGADRGYESQHDPTHRYPRPSDRPSMLDRDERPVRREHDPRADPRAVHDDRRYGERDQRPERDVRHERDYARGEREHVRPSERDHTRPSDRPERSERDHIRAGYPDRGRDEIHPPRARDTPTAGRPSAPTAPTPASTAAPAPTPAINPERAALIHGNDDRPSMSIRGQGQARDQTRHSRPTSPRRDEDRKGPPRGEADSKNDRRQDASRADPNSTPSGPSRNMPPGPSPRETRGRPPVDMTLGRLEQDSSHRPPARNERPQDAEPPSGPRGRPSNPNARNADPVPPPRPAPARQPPSGPGGRHSRQNSYADPAMSPQSADTTGVHPSRLNNLPAAEQPRNGRPPPVQTAPPSGPREPPTGPASATAPSPSTRGPPSGPQADSPAGRGGRHPVTAVNNHLAQAATGPSRGSGRGRGGARQNSMSFNAGGMPPSPVNGSNSQSFGGPQQDNPNGMPIQPRGPSRHDGTRGDDERRSTRNQQHDNRTQPQRNDRDGQGFKQDDNSMRNNRGPPPQNRDDGPPPRSGPRNFPRGPNPNVPRDDGPAGRKHPREENSSAPYAGGRGGRVTSEAKRPRRGG